MADVTITVALEGPDIPFDSFATAAYELNRLIKALSTEVAKDSRLAWKLEALEVGSAIATMRGRVLGGNPDGTIRVSLAYERVGWRAAE